MTDWKNVFLLLGLGFVAGLGGCASVTPAVVRVVEQPVVPGPPSSSPTAPMEGLDYWLPMTERAGDVAFDVTGHGHDGLIGGGGLGAVWAAGNVGLVPNQGTVTLANAGGRASVGICAYYPAGGTPVIPAKYSYLYGESVGGQNGLTLQTSYGPAGGILHAGDAYFPTVGRSNGAAETQSAVGFSGNHCVEVVAGDTDHIVVDGVEVSYLTQGSTPDLLGGAQLSAPMYIVGGNGQQFGVPVVVYSVWGAVAPDSVAQAALRTTAEIERLRSLGVAFGQQVSSATDSVCSFDGTSIDKGYLATGVNTSSLLQLNFACTIEDFSEYSQPSMDMVAGFDDRAGSVFHVAAARNIAYHGGVVNSLIPFKESPADALADVLAWNAKAKALGYKTIVSTMFSSCGTGIDGQAGDAVAQQFNALLLAHGESFDWVANHAAWPQIGASLACAPGGYFPDGVHVDARGQAMLAEDEKAAFEGVYGSALTRVSGPYTQLSSDRVIQTAGVSSFDVQLVAAETASFNSAGRLCVPNVGPAMIRLVPAPGESIDGQGAVNVQAGQSVCVRPLVLEATKGGAIWTVY